MASPSPSLSELASRLVASETERSSLATQLAETRHALWTERALRRFPSIEGAVDLIPHAKDEATFLASAERLAIYATSR